MTTQGKSRDRRIVAHVGCALAVAVLAAPSTSLAQVCEREKEAPCCHALQQAYPECLPCGDPPTDCCWLPDLNIKTVIADSVTYWTGQVNITFLTWADRCKYKSPNCVGGVCLHDGDWLTLDCNIANPARDDCPPPE